MPQSGSRTQLVALAALSGTIAIVLWLGRGDSLPVPMQTDGRAAVDAPASATVAAPEPIALQPRTAVTADHGFAAIPLAMAAPGSGPTLRYTCEVCDGSNASVAGATVTVLAARSEARTPTERDARDVVWLEPLPDAVLATTTTKDDGLCEFDLQGEFAWIRAEHPRFGRSIARAIGRFEQGPNRAVRLWLLRPVTVRGTVLAADGSPVAHARVSCTDVRPFGKFGPVGLVAADATGRFAFEVAVGMRCELEATSDAGTSMRVGVAAERDVEVLLPYAGAFGVRCRIAPAPGESLRLDATRVPPGRMSPTARRDAPVFDEDDGTWHLDVAGPGSYQVVARGQNGRSWRWSSPVVAEVTMQERWPTLDVAWHRPQTLHGMARNGDGTPAAHVEIRLAGRPDRRGGEPIIFTAADGSFACMIPPWEEVWVSGDPSEWHAVDPLHPAVELVVPEFRGFVVRGEVFDADGRPSPRFRLQWQSGHGEAFGPKEIHEGGTFDLAVKRQHRGLHVVIGSETGGPVAFLDPFTSSGENRVTIRLPAAAQVPVRVLANGRPARGLMVSIWHELAKTTAEWRTDRDGRVRLGGLTPGKNMLLVARGYEQLFSQEVELLPGSNPERVVAVDL